MLPIQCKLCADLQDTAGAIVPDDSVKRAGRRSMDQGLRIQESWLSLQRQRSSVQRCLAC